MFLSMIIVEMMKNKCMAKSGPIILVEDDQDDIDLFKEAMVDNDVENELKFFLNGPDAFEYLRTTTERPLLIICDVNLPRQNGIEFKTQIDNDPILRRKSIPFIFYSTYVSQYAVNEAYNNLTVQGFFQKNDSYVEFKSIVGIIIEYWSNCKHPNS